MHNFALSLLPAGLGSVALGHNDHLAMGVLSCLVFEEFTEAVVTPGQHLPHSLVMKLFGQVVTIGPAVIFHLFVRLAVKFHGDMQADYLAEFSSSLAKEQRSALGKRIIDKMTEDMTQDAVHSRFIEARIYDTETQLFSEEVWSALKGKKVLEDQGREE